MEYRTFGTRPNLSQMVYYEATRITLIVTDVKDSGGVTYSYITKNATGITYPEYDHYEKKYVITREGEKMTFPMDLYIADTTYLADKYTNLRKKSGYYTIMKTAGNFVISGDPGTGSFSYSPKTNTTELKIRDYKLDKNMGSGSSYFTEDLTESKYSIVASLKSFKIDGKEKVKTAAGTFECYKIYGTVEAKITGIARTFEGVSLVYYSPEIGFVKTEQEDAKVKTGYIELVRVKK
jgi:hypothetical protein